MKLLSLALATCLGLTTAAYAQQIAVVAVGGDSAPDGNGKLSDFDIPTMNSAGAVTVVTTLNATTGGANDNTAILRGTSIPGSLHILVRRGDPSPDGNGNFANLDSDSLPVINDSGEVAFIAGLSGTFGGGQDSTGIFRSDATGTALSVIVRQGQTIPGSPMRKLPNFRGGGIGAFSFDEMGEVAFPVTGIGIYRTASGSLTQIVRSQQPLPGGSGMFALLSAPALNDNGQVAFADGVAGIFRGDGSTITQIVHTGDASPDGNGKFAIPFAVPAINNAGAVGFFAMLAMTSGSASDNQGIFIFNGDALKTVARRGQPAPDGNGHFLDLSAPNNVAINEAGQAAFRATLTATTGGNTDNSGLFRGDGTTLTQIARTGEHLDDGSTINSLSEAALNDAGQVAFLAGLAGSGGSMSHAILVYDDQRGLLQAVRTGDALLGSRIGLVSTLIFEPSVTANGKKRGSLNANGLVVFRFDLDDGRRGIAIADAFAAPATPTPTPSPSSSPTPVPTNTPGGPATPCAGKRCFTPAATSTANPTNTPAASCTGDCNGSNDVAVNEIVQLVNFALGTNTDCSTCTSGIPPGVSCPGDITVSVIIRAVNNALNACPAQMPPTPTPRSKEK